VPRSTMTSKGQITIPKELRDRLGLEPGAVLDFVEDERGRILLSKSGGNGALGSLRHRAPAHPVSVDQMRQAVRRKARAKAGAGR
jgi:AbrB family looped-hinge helix DNA binding protein